MKRNLGARLTNALIRCWVAWLYLALHVQLRRYRSAQLELAQRYQLDHVTPEAYTAATRARIVELARRTTDEPQFAWTSGTTHEPKQIFYPPARVQLVQHTMLEQVLLAYEYARLDRPAFYLLTSMAPDRSWSSLFIRKSFPPFLQRLLMSDSLLFVPGAAELVGRYSQSAVHLALWLIAEPSFIVAANPSSLYIVLEQQQRDWLRIREELERLLREPAIVRVREQFASGDAARQERITRHLKATTPPTVAELLPGLRAVYCWDGGYVQPFIDGLTRAFGAQPIQFIPMLSLSTETIAYQMYPCVSVQGGLPMLPGNCYEFIAVEEAENDEQATANQAVSSDARILKPWELEPGRAYVMLVSDAYGLRRYNTEDVFECRGMRHHTPILHFQRRVGLRYSFTGEKVTAEQLLHVYGSIRTRFELDGAILTSFPTLNHGKLPGYVFVYCALDDAPLPPCLTAQAFDARLCAINDEYAAKRRSGRLAAPQLVCENYATLVERIRESNPRYRGSNPAQFKLLPLYRVMWEELFCQPAAMEVVS